MLVVEARVGLVLVLGEGGRRKACCTEREANRQIVARRRAARVPAMPCGGGRSGRRGLLMIIAAVVVLIGPWNAGWAYVRVMIRWCDVMTCWLGALIGQKKTRARQAGCLGDACRLARWGCDELS